MSICNGFLGETFRNGTPRATSEYSTSSPWQFSLLSVQKTKVEPAISHGETPLTSLQSKGENAQTITNKEE